MSRNEIGELYRAAFKLNRASVNMAKLEAGYVNRKQKHYNVYLDKQKVTWVLIFSHCKVKAV